MRTYDVKSGKVWSVTTILGILRSPTLENWRGHVGNQVADAKMSEGASRGTAVHSVVEHVNIHGYPPQIHNEQLARYAEGYANFYSDCVDQILATELQVESQDPPYAGRCDIIARMNDGLVAMIDVKTSKFIGEKMGIQLAAYADCVNKANKEGRSLILPRDVIITEKPDRVKITGSDNRTYGSDHAGGVSQGVLLSNYILPKIDRHIIVQVSDSPIRPNPPGNASVYRVGEDNEYVAYEFNRPDEDLAAFRALCDLHKWVVSSGLWQSEFVRKYS